jgi:uncharacterized protein with HEPN domain
MESETKPAKMGYEGKEIQAQTQLGDCLWDAHAAGGKILEFTTGRSFAEFEENELLRSVVTKMLEIMTEALSELRRHHAEEFSRLDAARLIERAGGDLEIWRLAMEVVPELTVQIQTRLEEWHQS